MDVMKAAFNVAHDYRGGAHQLALDIGENPNTFSHALTETGGAKLGLKTAVKMSLRAPRDLRILQAFAAECGQMVTPLPEALDLLGGDCMRALADTSKEFNDLVQEVCRSLADDGKINANELQRIDREGGELVAQLHRLLAMVRASHLASQAGDAPHR